VRRGLLALALVLAVTPSAFADGDPASDVLLVKNVFVPYPAPSAAASNELAAAVRSAYARGYRVKVAVIASETDLGSIPSLFNRPNDYAKFLGQELQLYYIGPLLIVMPNGYASKTGKKDTGAFEEDLLKDIVPFVESHYAAKSDRDNRAIAGQSMGGGQALRIGLKNLDKFAWIAGFSPALGNTADIVPDIDGASKKLKLFWVSCGDKDAMLKGNESFHQSLDAKKVPHQWHVGSGDHSFVVWKNDLYLFAQVVFR